MRHPKQSPQIEHAKSFWAIEITRDRSDQWRLFPQDIKLQDPVAEAAMSDRLAWIASHRKRARQRARDLRKVATYYAVRVIKLQRFTRP